MEKAHVQVDPEAVSLTRRAAAFVIRAAGRVFEGMTGGLADFVAVQESEIDQHNRAASRSPGQ